MLQPKNLLMKRGTLLGREPRVDQKVFAAIGFSDFTSGISIVFFDCCPATVSDSETVFLCPLSSSTAAPQPITTSHGRHYSPPAVAAAASASARAVSQLLRHG